MAGLFDAKMLAAERRHDDLESQLRGHLPLLEQALTIDGDCGAAYLSRAIWGTGSTEARDADFRRGLQLDPSNGRGLIAYAEFLDRNGRRDEATSVLDRALRIDPMSPRAHFWRVMRDFDTRGGRSLEAGVRRVLEIDPNYHPALQRYAKYRWMLHGELAEAAQVIEHAIEIDPANPWSRHTAVAIYLDLGDVDAAEAVAAESSRTRATSRVLLGLHAGDWRAAGAAALSPAGTEYNRFESWGVPEAIRDFALHSGDHGPAIRFLEDRYGLQEGNAPDVSNLRAAACLAELLRETGQARRADQLLAQLSTTIDSVIEKHGPVIALRTRATVQLLRGEQDAALATLADSFAADDLMQWWYTLERDALWGPLHGDPRFEAIDADVRMRVAREQATLAELRKGGRIVQRGARGSEP
jgi:Tfp pilus assembly protein PilF